MRCPQRAHEVSADASQMTALRGTGICTLPLRQSADYLYSRSAEKSKVLVTCTVSYFSVINATRL